MKKNNSVQEQVVLAPFGTRAALKQAVTRYADCVSKVGNIDNLTFEFDYLFTQYCAVEDIHPTNYQEFEKWVHLCAEYFLKMGALREVEHDVIFFDIDVYKVISVAELYVLRFWHDDDDI